MELVGYFALAYLWQCVARLPAGSLLFVEGLRTWRQVEGGGWRIAHPLPSRLTLVVTRGASNTDALSVARFEEALARARRATRWASAYCDVYLLIALLVVPGLAVLHGSESALSRVLPVLLLLHSVIWVLLWRAQRRFATPGVGTRWEPMLVAALYPPALLRAPHDLIAASLAHFHPMTVRAALWPRAQLVEAVQQALAREAAGASEAGIDQGALYRLAAERGVTERDLAAPRLHLDASAASYCALCLSDYRPGYTQCADCGRATTPYVD